MNTRLVAPHRRVLIRKIVPRPTVEMPKIELEAILTVDAAIGMRDAIHYHPTVQMEAVKVTA